MCVCVCLFRASAQLPQSHQPAGAISTKQCGRSPRTWQHFKILSQGGGAQGIVVALGEKENNGTPARTGLSPSSPQNEK